MVFTVPRLDRAIYRTRQVVHALNPRVGQDELEAARSLLGPSLAPLFLNMEKRDQRHALEVTRRLRDQRADDQELLQAALLHDCGKGSVPIWLRILKVLAPGLVRRAGTPTARGWRAAAYRLSHHAELGASLALAAGCSPGTAELIRGDVSPGNQERMRLLLLADDAS